MMLSLGKRGIAATTIIVAVVAVSGAGVGTPVAVDEMDTQPDSPLYGLEKAGEAIKESTYAGGQGWDIARADERTSEFVNMAEKGKANRYRGLLDDAGNRLIKAAKEAEDNEGLQKAQEVLERHTEVLERIRENVPDVAKQAISLAISRSARCQVVLADVKSGELPAPAEAKERLDEVQQKIEGLKREVRENRGKVPPERIVQNIELGTAKELSQKFAKMAEKGKANMYRGLLDEAGDRFTEAAEHAYDNRGLERARKALQKHSKVLENLEVPVEARPAIELAIERSFRSINTIIRIAENEQMPKRAEMPEELKEDIANRLEKIREEVESKRENAKKMIRKGRNPRTVAQEIAQEWRTERAEELIEMFQEKFEENFWKYRELVEEAEDYLENATKEAVDNQGLQRAIEACQKHLRVLENVKKKVPDQAKPAIVLAIERSSRCIQVLENKEILPAGRRWMPEWAKKRLGDRLDEIKERIEERRENWEEEWGSLEAENRRFTKLRKKWAENYENSWRKWAPEECEEFMPEEWTMEKKLGKPGEMPKEMFKHFGKTWGSPYFFRIPVSGKIVDNEIDWNIEHETSTSFGAMEHESGISGNINGSIANGEISAESQGTFYSTTVSTGELIIDAETAGEWSGSISGTLIGGSVIADFEGEGSAEMSGSVETDYGTFEWNCSVSYELTGKMNGSITDNNFEGYLIIWPSNVDLGEPTTTGEWENLGEPTTTGEWENIRGWP